ncbi:hypothetical protein L596_008448 [Steinernema carpocapsae]|uniref:Uncharacterized protein n=1 Tax=Steinernema carpocapsae TaxID=34508 RepID=A0A4U5PCN4_STECR|nr:hypothetical protein L596_008448 [Steinernema carpocapsae]
MAPVGDPRLSGPRSVIPGDRLHKPIKPSSDDPSCNPKHRLIPFRTPSLYLFRPFCIIRGLARFAFPSSKRIN